MSNNYVADVLTGDALWTEIEDYVARWHESDEDRGIDEFLGMTRSEYELFVEQPPALRFILAAHERDEPVEEIIRHAESDLVAARGLDRSDAEKIRDWLRRTGRLAAD